MEFFFSARILALQFQIHYPALAIVHDTPNHQTLLASPSSFLPLSLRLLRQPLKHRTVLQHVRHYDESDLGAADEYLLIPHHLPVPLGDPHIIQPHIHRVLHVSQVPAIQLPRLQFHSNDMLLSLVK